ncbi:MAG: Mismatch repair protein msh3 [Bogoriella megaspora]|nr:MAG: Mismatch repair protein msh3 [Bogoriella megaspora]
MPSAQSPALARSESSQKKQQSISSFFTPKPASTPKHSEQSSPLERDDPPNRNEHEKSNSLFVSSDDDLPPLAGASNKLKRKSDEAGNTSREAGSQSKRKRQLQNDNGEHGEQSESGDETEAAFKGRKSLGQASAADLNGVRKPRLSERTSKYLFSSSPAGDENEPEIDDEESRKLKENLHRRFVKKLGKPDSIADIKRRNNFIAEETIGGDEGAEDEDADAGESSLQPTKGKKGVSAKKGSKKLTPMEQQIVDLKRKYMDTLLVVEVGYKFRFFGEDARVAAKELGIVCIPGKFRFDEHPSEAHLDRFASASFPVHRLHVHVKRLVNAGHKVGVVRQTETAALKAVGDNRNAPFTRKVTNLYTKGTYIDDVEALEGQLAEASRRAPGSGYLLCLTESKAKGWDSDEKVRIGLVAVQPSVGDVVYDDFEDGFMRSEIETRLLHIAPCEILLVGEMSKATEKLVKHLSGSKANVFGDKVRLDRVEKPKTMAASAYSQVSKFYADKMKAASEQSSSQSDRDGTFLDKIHNLSEHVTICLSAMITHLTDYGLEHVLDLTKYFQSFSARSHMLLNGNTLTSLELYHNQTDHSEKGSLFWTLDRTQTRFGQRLLRKWVGRPLLDKHKLEERVAAVEELKDSGSTVPVDKLKHVLSKIKGDLERTLIRIYYKKCTRPELLSALQTLQYLASEYVRVRTPADAGFQSNVLNEAFASLPTILDDVIGHLDKINAQAAKEDDKYSFFRDEHESDVITDHKLGIATVEAELNEHRKVAAEKLKKKNVEYVTVAQIEYLIEVDNTQLKNVPASWAKISGTKKVSRFHTPEVVRFMRERDQHKEALAAACDTAFVELLTDIGTKYQSFRDCIQSLALLDCLMSLAEVANQPGYVKPEFTDEICISVKEGRHPMVEQLLLDTYVPNDIQLSSDETRALLITGPNMGGKSSYVRQVALIAIMGQIGSYVPAASAKLGMLDAVFTRMGAFDNMLAGESTFMVELHETADILKQASPRSLVILDELGRGTSTHDGVAIAQAVLDYVVREQKSLTLFITHYQNLAAMEGAFNGELRNVHMRFKEEKAADGAEEVTFLYEVGEGVAHRSYGLNVARLAHVPKAVLDVASVKSREMEVNLDRKKIANLTRMMCTSIAQSDDIAFDHLLSSFEHL